MKIYGDKLSQPNYEYQQNKKDRKNISNIEKRLQQLTV